MTEFPALSPIPEAVSDSGVHLGDSAIKANTPTRRQILTIAAAIPLVSLVACQEATNVTTAVTDAATQLTNDINTITAGLAGVLPNVQGITGAGAAIVADIQAAIAKGKTLAAQVSTAVQNGVSKAAPIVNEVAGVVGAIASDVAGLGNLGINVPSWVADIVLAAKTLVPIALTLAGVALADAVVATGMSADQARLILRAAAAKSHA